MTERTPPAIAPHADALEPTPDASLDAPRWWVEPAMIVAFWTMMALLTAVGQLLDPRASHLRPALPAASVGLAFAASYLWAALTPLVFRLSERYALERARWRSRVAVLLAAGVLVAVVMEATVAWLRLTVFFQPRDVGFAFNPLYGMKRLFWLDDLVVYLAVVAAGVARDYFRRLQARQGEAVRLQGEAARLTAEAARLEAQLAEARLTALRAQLDPHFLFNTLNAVSSLVGSDPRGVRRMIARLSELLRHSLEDSVKPEVPLSQELRVLRQYAEIMEIRFEGRLRVGTDVEPGALDALVPNMILQPLVENAIKHGVGRLPNASAGRVDVTGRRVGDELILVVRDNGPLLEDGGALAHAMARPGGVGLRNTRERLAQLYGAAHTFTLAAAPGGGTIATVTLPYHALADFHVAAVEAEAAGRTPTGAGAARGRDDAT